MFDAGLLILNLTMTAVAIWIVQKFMGVFLTKKPWSIASIFVWSGFAIYQMLIMYGYGIMTAWALFVNLTFFFLISIFCHGRAGKIKFLLSLALYAVWVLVEMIAYYCLQYLQLEKNAYEIAGASISKMLMIIVVSVLAVLWRKQENGFIPTKYFLILLLFPLGSIYIALAGFHSGAYNSSTIFPMTAISILLFFNVFIFELYSKQSKLLDYEKEKTVYTQLINGMARSTQEKERLMEEFQEEKHNLINKLIVLRENIMGSESDVAVRYLDEIVKKCSTSDEISDNGNRTVDALINSKYAVAKEQGIEFRTKIHIPEKLPIDPCDMGIILGNSLDNAIEAVGGCEKSEKIISISMGLKKESLVLLVENPFEHPLHKDNAGKYISTKAEADRHGYGLGSIKRVAEKYDGEVLIESNNSVFTLTVLVGLVSCSSPASWSMSSWAVRSTDCRRPTAP